MFGKKGAQGASDTALAETESTVLAERNDLFGRIPVYTDTDAQMSEEQLLQAIANAASAEEASTILHAGAGMIPFADKALLSEAGTGFKILRIGIREGKAFDSAKTGYEDDIACVIEYDQGGRAVLTFEQNPKRNAFIFGAHAAIAQFGYLPNCALQKYDKKEPGQRFYAVVPTNMWTGDQTHQEPRRVN